MCGRVGGLVRGFSCIVVLISDSVLGLVFIFVYLCDKLCWCIVIVLECMQNIQFRVSELPAYGSNCTTARYVDDSSVACLAVTPQLKIS